MLSEYTRKQDRFVDVFGVTPAQLIREMDNSAADVASQRPKYETKLAKVGVQRHSIPVDLLDPLDKTKTHQISCNIRISVSLEAMLRGIHVSRMGNAIAEVSSSQPFQDLLCFTTALADHIALSQGADSCQVGAEGVYTFIEQVKGWEPSKDKKSVEAIPLIAETTSLGNGVYHNTAGLRWPHMTACPCVQGAMNTLLSQKQTKIQGPRFTHSQRCETEVRLVDIKKCFDFGEALGLIDQITARTLNTLPREYELALVHDSHNKPSFLEDVVRVCANKFYSTFAALFNPEGAVHVSSVSQESIHSFDLHAEAYVPCISETP